MTVIFSILLRLAVWFLLTANLSLINIIIGVAIAISLPHDTKGIIKGKDWFIAVSKTILALPIAYVEAIQMMLKPHTQEKFTYEAISPNRSYKIVFLDIFYITFTPKTLVSRYDPQSGYQVHHIYPK